MAQSVRHVTLVFSAQVVISGSWIEPKADARPLSHPGVPITLAVTNLNHLTFLTLGRESNCLSFGTGL